MSGRGATVNEKEYPPMSSLPMCPNLNTKVRSSETGVTHFLGSSPEYLKEADVSLSFPTAHRLTKPPKVHQENNLATELALRTLSTRGQK